MAPRLERAIGPVSATLLVIGSVIGSGIFLTTGAMAQVMPSPTLILLAWAAGCLFALTGALTYAELGALFPRSGGVYVFLREAFGPLVGFLYGWAMMLVVLAGGIAAVAIGFADSLSYFVPVLAEGAGQKVVAAGSIVVLGAVNYLGVRAGSRTNAVLTVAKVSGLVLLFVFALTSAKASPAFTPIAPAAIQSPFAAFGVAVIAVLWAAEGYYFLTYAAGEIRDPVRTIPRALVLGLIAIAVIYLAANLAYLYALPMDELRGTTRVAEKAATALVGPMGATLVTLTVVISTLGANAAVLLGGSRLLYAMAETGLFFAAAAKVHPRFHSPHIAIVVLTVWSSILALSGTYEQLFTYVVFTSVLFSLLGGLALFWLRLRRPDAERPYRVWGYPVIPAVFVASSLVLAVNTLAQRPTQSLAGLGLLVLGLPAYAYWKRCEIMDTIDVESRHSVDDTVDKLKGILAAKGVTLFALVDHSGEAEKVGLTMPPTKLLIFGNPKAGTPLMQAAPRTALDLPLKILVWQDAAGTVRLTYTAPASLRARHGFPAELVANIAVIEALAKAAAS